MRHECGASRWLDAHGAGEHDEAHETRARLWYTGVTGQVLQAVLAEEVLELRSAVEVFEPMKSTTVKIEACAC